MMESVVDAAEAKSKEIVHDKFGQGAPTGLIIGVYPCSTLYGTQSRLS